MVDRKTGLTRGVQGSEATNAQLNELERRMQQIKRAYEMYFTGIEKRPPLVAMDALSRDIRKLSTTGYATATLRFKVQNLVSRFNQYKSLWERQMRQFEEGKYRPGVGAAPGRSPHKKRR